MTRKIFIDTEFTDFLDCHLISLGMVAETGEEFYVEVPYPDAACSVFVREAVIPLLGSIENAQCPFEELRHRILSWLNLIRNDGATVAICFDYQTDWDLFNDAMDYRIPDWCCPRSIARNINELLRYSFYKKNSLPEHHALHDAKANRYAFCERSTLAD
ncbi:3'-5' exoribonuclease [Herbaspirillum sp. alder98]|uniref:3'-5' exoribonuclease n=1 Tax=Herbaspirillum sp. alder98 TaxID=2913096 RepID=UPI001CD81C6F|nr:3'-5' exoribonuclease [Herbaspirillum sp. alder98]MCA1322877.1 3'-5' exoribonuclease [Herbaspirillum sp. alder98]